MNDIQTRVERGAVTLDNYFGSRSAWTNKINPDDLEICSSDRCILGQVFGDYWRGKRKLGLEHADLASACGFVTAITDSNEMINELNAAWCMFIRNARVPEPARLELTPRLLEQLTELSSQLHDPENPMPVIELELGGVRIALV